MNIHIKTPFNEELYRYQTNIAFNISMDKNKQKNNEYLIFTFGCLGIGFFFTYFLFEGAGMIVGPLLMITGFIYGVAFVSYKSKLNKTKINYYKIIDEEVKRQSESNELIELQFTDDHFYYNDIDQGYKLSWKKITSFLIAETVVFLVLNNENFACFSIPESVLGTKNYNELEQFLESNLKPYPYDHRYKKSTKSNPELIDG